MCIRKKELDSLRTVRFSEVSQIFNATIVYAGILEKKRILTNCYSKIVTKDHQKP